MKVYKRRKDGRLDVDAARIDRKKPATEEEAKDMDALNDVLAMLDAAGDSQPDDKGETQEQDGGEGEQEGGEEEQDGGEEEEQEGGEGEEEQEGGEEEQEGGEGEGEGEPPPEDDRPAMMSDVAKGDKTVTYKLTQQIDKVNKRVSSSEKNAEGRHKRVMALIEAGVAAREAGDAAVMKYVDAKFAEQTTRVETVVIREDAKGEKVSEKVVKGQHKLFTALLKRAEAGIDTMLIGPAGCGKTHLVKSVFDALGMQSGSISCTAGTSESKFTGLMLPSATGGFQYVTTTFLKMVEEGGGFLMDEIDAADSNVLLIFNQLLANGELPVPARADNPVAKRHPKFVMVAAANTFGRGANRMYVGRNQLDESTLDRFSGSVFEMDYDKDLEIQLVENEELRKAMWSIRHKAEEHKLRRIVSTRAMLAGQRLVKMGLETNASYVQRFLSGWTPEERGRVGY